MTYYTPKLQEDLEFCASNWRYVEGLTDHINWKAMWNDIIFHYTYTNGRLGDRFVIPVMTLVPQWLFAIINGMVALLLVMGVAKNASLAITHRVSTIVILPVSIAMALLWFPWNETVFIESYALNYLWTACLATWIAYMALKPTFAAKLNPGCVAAASIAFFIAGTWHECIFTTLGIALILVSLFSDKSRRRTLLIWMTALLLGFLANILTGGLRTRVAGTPLIFDYHRWYNTWHRIPIPTWPVMGVVVYILSLVTAIVISKIRISMCTLKEIPNNPQWTLHSVCAITGICNIFLYAFFGTPRTLLIGDTFAAIGFVALAFSLPDLPVRRAMKAILTALSMLLLINLMFTILFQRKVADSFYTLKQEWLKSDNGFLFVDDQPLLNYSAPYPWHMIIGDMYLSDWKHFYLSTFIRPDDPPKNFILLPAELSEVNPDKLKPVECAPGLYHHGRHLIYISDEETDKNHHIYRDSNFIFGSATIIADTGKGSPETLYYFLTPFTPRVGPKTCYYLNPLTFDFDFSRTIHSINSATLKLPVIRPKT